MTSQQRAARMNAALAAALAHGLCSRVGQVTDTEYVVPSTSNPRRWYVVEVIGADYRCTCTAGQLGQPCQHSAAVYRVRHGLVAARVTVREPAAAPVAAESVAAPIARDGRGVGLNGHSLGEPDDAPSLAELAAAAGCQSARDYLDARDEAAWDAHVNAA